MRDIVEIKFVNSDARPKVVAGKASREFVTEIMSWYGSHFAGDRYAVYIDGHKVLKDQNGELASDIYENVREIGEFGDGVTVRKE